MANPVSGAFGPPAGQPRARGETVRIVSAAELGGAARLQGLAEQVFGAGDRPRGWFTRKLRRERVDDALSVVAVDPAHPTEDPAGWLGYVLVGVPPSLGDRARTSGTAVVSQARGRGVATELLNAASGRCRDAGIRHLQLLAEAAVLPFYLQRGFRLVHPTMTALSFGRATAASLTSAPAWDSPTEAQHELVAWLPEAWSGTDAEARRGCEFEVEGRSVQAWLSREGVAWLVQRIVASEGAPLPSIAGGLLDRLPHGAPVLLPLLNADAPSSAALLDAGWVAAQRGALVERSLYSPPVGVG